MRQKHFRSALRRVYSHPQTQWVKSGLFVGRRGLAFGLDAYVEAVREVISAFYDNRPITLCTDQRQIQVSGSNYSGSLLKIGSGFFDLALFGAASFGIFVGWTREASYRDSVRGCTVDTKDTQNQRR